MHLNGDLKHLRLPIYVWSAITQRMIIVISPKIIETMHHRWPDLTTYTVDLLIYIRKGEAEMDAGKNKLYHSELDQLNGRVVVRTFHTQTHTE